MPTNDDLERLLATQNQGLDTVDNSPQAIAPPAPQPQPSNVEQVLSQPQQPSKLGQFLSGFGGMLQGQNPQQAIKNFKDQQFQEKQRNLEAAKALDEVHASKAGTPTLKAVLKGLPGITPEVSQAIDGMDDTTLRNFTPRLADSFKLQNDIQDALLKPKREAETERHNLAEEGIQKLHYENLLKEQQNKNQEKNDQQTTKRVDDTLDTLATVKRGASAGTFGMATKRSALAADGLRILDQIKSGQIKADPSVQQELATVMASSLSGGAQPGEHAIRAFVNRTGQGDAAKAAIYLSSAPQSAVSKAFLKQWEDQLKGQDKYYRDLRDQTIGSQWEKLKPSLDKSPTEKARFIRSVKAQYPEFDISKLGEKNSDYGFGPLSGKSPKAPKDLDSMSDDELKAYIQGK